MFLKLVVNGNQHHSYRLSSAIKGFFNLEVVAGQDNSDDFLLSMTSNLQVCRVKGAFPY